MYIKKKIEREREGEGKGKYCRLKTVYTKRQDRNIYKVAGLQEVKT